MLRNDEFSIKGETLNDWPTREASILQMGVARSISIKNVKRRRVRLPFRPEKSGIPGK